MVRLRSNHERRPEHRRASPRSIGDHARAEILTALMGGEALTATELARASRASPSRPSARTSRSCVDARLLAVESQGRHRYFRLADRDVADLLESLMGVAYRAGRRAHRSSPREPALRKARVCYDHLAGDLGVLRLRQSRRDDAGCRSGRRARSN